jgi:hypothetical protein
MVGCQHHPTPPLLRGNSDDRFRLGISWRKKDEVVSRRWKRFEKSEICCGKVPGSRKMADFNEEVMFVCMYVRTFMQYIHRSCISIVEHMCTICIIIALCMYACMCEKCSAAWYTCFGLFLDSFWYMAEMRSRSRMQHLRSMYWSSTPISRQLLGTL